MFLFIIIPIYINNTFKSAAKLVKKVGISKKNAEN